nr:VWA-like domain-containing protein [uncultured Blautia sp.]
MKTESTAYKAKQGIHSYDSRQVQIGMQILENCRNQLLLSCPSFDQALFFLQWEADERIAGIGTDGEKIFFSPLWLLRRYQEDPETVTKIYLHMVLHCLYLHPFLAAKEQEGLWDLACDLSVERISASITKRDGRGTHKAQELSPYRIYDTLCGLKKEELADLKKDVRMDDHSLWREKQTGDSRIWKQWEQLLLSMSRGKEKKELWAGMAPDWRQEEIRLSGRRDYDYRDFLQKYFHTREEVKLDTESFDYIFYNYGMEHYGDVPLIEPLEYREVSRLSQLVIAIDTSGSCSVAVVQRFLEETYSILSSRENFFNEMEVYLIQCDCCIQKTDVIRREEDWRRLEDKIEIQGRGGTDFRPVFRYVDQLRREGQLKELGALIYFTDGDGVYPEESPEFDTAFVFLKDTDSLKMVPSWAYVLKVWT